jgi:hypothetical protein
MKLNLTKDEYRLLLDLVYLGDWMITAHQVGEDAPLVKKYEPLVQKILSYASEAGLDDLVEKSKDDGRFHPTRKLEEEEGNLEVIFAYDEDSFWHELIDRLSERDVLAHTSDGKMPKFEEYYKVAGPLEEMYANEFEARGLERLRLMPNA